MKTLTLTSKAKTLELLVPHLLSAKVLPVFRFNVQKFQSNLIIRSSLQNEDNEKTSNAGGFDSVMDVDYHDTAALQEAIEF